MHKSYNELLETVEVPTGRGERIEGVGTYVSKPIKSNDSAEALKHSMSANPRSHILQLQLAHSAHPSSVRVNLVFSLFPGR